VTIDSKFDDSTVIGLAILSLGSVVIWFANSWYVGASNHEHISRLLSYLERDQERTRKSVASIVFWYGTGGVALSVVLSGFWIVNMILAMEDRMDDPGILPFVVLHSVVCSYNISVFCMATALFGVVTNLHRNQATSYLELLGSGALNVRYATFFYGELIQSVAKTSSNTSWWTFPLVSLNTLSVVFQGWSYVHENAKVDTTYNGIYYFVLSLLALLFMFMSSASVTRKCAKVNMVATTLYPTATGVASGDHLRRKKKKKKKAESDIEVPGDALAGVSTFTLKELDRFVNFTALARPIFKIAGMAMTPLFSNAMLLLVFMVVGGFLREIFLQDVW